MQRKLIQQGESTLMVSLPAPWIKKHNLTKGQLIELDYAGNGILIKTDTNSNTKTSTSLELTTDNESSIRAKITTAYRKGIDVVTVHFSSNEQFEIMQHVIKTRLLGYDIISRTENNCSVETIVEPSYSQFENIFRKIFFNFTELCNITKDHLQNKKNPTPYFEVAQRIQQYDNFCRRAISKNILADRKNEFMWAFLTVFVHASRDLDKVNKLPSAPKDATLCELLDVCIAMGNQLLRAYEKKNITELDLIYQLQNDAIYKTAYTHFAKTKNPQQLFHIASCLRQLYYATSNLAGVIL